MAAPSPGTSASLLDQARDQQPEAWNRLAAIYLPVLQAWVASAGLQAADRDDLTQRVLEVLVRRLPEFAPSGRPGAFRVWLRGITVNLLHEFWRKRPTHASESVLAELADPHTALSQLWDAEHDRHVLHALMEKVRPEFTEATWQAFRLAALEGQPAPAVAAQLGLSANAVHIAKSRVLARLRQLARGIVD